MISATSLSPSPQMTSKMCHQRLSTSWKNSPRRGPTTHHQNQWTLRRIKETRMTETGFSPPQAARAGAVQTPLYDAYRPILNPFVHKVRRYCGGVLNYTS